MSTNQVFNKVLLEQLQTNKAYKISKDIILILLSLIIPLSMALILFATNKFYPFSSSGDTLLMIDSQSEYIAYMRYFKSILENDQGLIYTLGKVYGGDFLSIYTFYLSSPLNFLIVFFPYETLPNFFLFLTIIKITLTGLTMYLCLRFSYQRSRLIYLLFSTSYAFISYSFVYCSNIMWLDGVMILPLVILGINFLFKEKHYWIYFLSLAYTLICGWYIGAFICLFVIFFYGYKMLSIYGEARRNKERFKWQKYLFTFFIFSLIGGFLSSFNWLVAFLHLSGTKASGMQNIFNLEFFGFASFFDGLIVNGLVNASQIREYRGFMTMFTSIPVLVYVQLFFFNKKYTLFERLSSLSLFLLYFFALSFRGLNTLFHGGQDPTWFPARYSFIFGFLICYFASKESEDLKAAPLYGFILPTLSLIIVPLIVYLVPSYTSEGLLPQVSVPGLVIYFFTLLSLFIYKLVTLKNYYAKFSLNLLLTITLISLSSYTSYLGASNIMTVFKEDQIFQNIETYFEDDAYTPYFDYIKSLEDSNDFRMENTFLRPGSYNRIDNEPLFYNYNGLSHFSSSEKKSVEEYHEKLGFHYNGFFEKYDGGSTLAINSFLGVKYLLDDENYYSTSKPSFLNQLELLSFPSYLNDEAMKLYQNQYALPLGFAVSKNDSAFISTSYQNEDDLTYNLDHFEYQNALFRALNSHLNKNIFTKIDIGKPSFSDDISVNRIYNIANPLSMDEKDVRQEYYLTMPPRSQIIYNFNLDESLINRDDVNLYFYFLYQNENLSIRLNNRVYSLMDYWNEGIRGFNRISTNEYRLIITNVGEEEITYRLSPEFYYEDLTILKEYIDSLKQNPISLTPHSSFTKFSYQGTFVKGENFDEFMFTLPYEENIQIKIDGKKMPTYLTKDIFVGVDISSLSNENHQIEIIYIDRGVVYSIVLFSFALVGILAYYVVTYYLNKKNRPN